MARIVKVNAMSLGVLMRHLTEGPHTFVELAELTGLHYTTVREWVGSLHAQRVVHIIGYEKDIRGRDNAPLWQFGIDKKDAKKSKMTPNERAARYRAKMRQARVLGLMAGALSG